MRQALGCGSRKPDELRDHVGGAELWIRRWNRCTGGELVLMIHPGGHVVPAGWIERVLDWFEGLDAPR